MLPTISHLYVTSFVTYAFFCFSPFLIFFLFLDMKVLFAYAVSASDLLLGR